MLLKVLYLVASMLVATSVSRYVTVVQDRDLDDYRRSHSSNNWVPFDFRFGYQDSIRCKVYVPEEVHGAIQRTWGSVTDDEESHGNFKDKIKSALGGLYRSFRATRAEPDRSHNEH